MKFSRWALVTAGALLVLQPARFWLGAQTVETAAVRAASARPQPGDRLFVHIVGEPLLSDTVTVNERGEVALARLGVLNIARLSISELQDTVRARYARLYREPAVEVNVLRRIAVNGSVKNPSLYLVDLSSTLRDVIAQAGGVSDNGDRGKVYIVRGGDRIHVPNWESDASRASDLMSGDQIVVDRQAWWKSNIFALTSTAVLIASFAISLMR